MMSTHARVSPGISNAGPSTHRARRRTDGMAAYILSGIVAWVDREGARIVLRIDETNRRGRRFHGRTVTADLANTKFRTPDRDDDGVLTTADLLPGERVTVNVRMPRRLGEIPATIAPSSLEAHDHSI